MSECLKRLGLIDLGSRLLPQAVAAPQHVAPAVCFLKLPQLPQLPLAVSSCSGAAADAKTALRRFLKLWGLQMGAECVPNLFSSMIT